jgi:hypothetical protein
MDGCPSASIWDYVAIRSDERHVSPNRRGLRLPFRPFGGLLDGIVRSRTKGHGVCLFVFLLLDGATWLSVPIHAASSMTPSVKISSCCTPVDSRPISSRSSVSTGPAWDQFCQRAAPAQLHSLKRAHKTAECSSSCAADPSPRRPTWSS